MKTINEINTELNTMKATDIRNFYYDHTNIGGLKGRIAVSKNENNFRMVIKNDFAMFYTTLENQDLDNVLTYIFGENAVEDFYFCEMVGLV